MGRGMNPPQSLEDIVRSHRGKLIDKWELYLKKYDEIFASYRNKPISLLEIGVQDGGSLEVWAKYFPRAKLILGCDINKRCGDLKFKDSRIKIVIGDIKENSTVEKLLKLSPSFDIIIDDGSHHPEDIIIAFTKLFPHLRDRGIYIVEDLHTNYWEKFDGGLLAPHTAVEFFKRLVDVLNYEAWGMDIPRKSVLEPFFEKINLKIEEESLSHIHSISFVNSIVIIEKRSPEENSLGHRVVRGEEETVTENYKLLDGSTLKDFIPSSSTREVHFKEKPPLQRLILFFKRKLYRLGKCFKSLISS